MIALLFLLSLVLVGWYWRKKRAPQAQGEQAPAEPVFIQANDFWEPNITKAPASPTKPKKHSSSKRKKRRRLAKKSRQRNRS